MSNKIVLIVFLFFIISIDSCSSNPKYTKEVNELIDSYKSAINNRKYDEIKRFLSEDFVIDGINKDASLIQFYSYVNFNLSKKIKLITINKIDSQNDSIIIIKAVQTFENNENKVFYINCKVDKGLLKIFKLNDYLPNGISFTTRASYINESIFGNNRIENIKRLTILDKSKADSIVGDNYIIYYDSHTLKGSAKIALDMYKKLDSLMINKYRFACVGN